MANSRTIISIPEETKVWLESYSKANAISMAEAIRKGIRYLRKEEERDTFQSILNHTSGLWKEGDGLQYQKKIRSEWE